MDLVQGDGETLDSAQREMGSGTTHNGENRQLGHPATQTGWLTPTLAKANSCLLVSPAKFVSAAGIWESFQQLTQKSTNCSRVL